MVSVFICRLPLPNTRQKSLSLHCNDASRAVVEYLEQKDKIWNYNPFKARFTKFGVSG
nr:MAG TPA: hypothetical protein [Caudoviricetes sp.]